MEDKIDFDIGVCYKHIKKTNDVHLKKFLTLFLIIRISGYYDEMIKEILSKKIEKMNDKKISHLFEPIISRYYSNIKTKKMKKEIFKKMGKNASKKFLEISNPNAIAQYDSIISNRNAAAHGEDTSFGIDNLINAHSIGKQVLKTFSDTLDTVDHSQIQYNKHPIHAWMNKCLGLCYILRQLNPVMSRIRRSQNDKKEV